MTARPTTMHPTTMHPIPTDPTERAQDPNMTLPTLLDIPFLHPELAGQVARNPALRFQLALTDDLNPAKVPNALLMHPDCPTALHRAALAQPAPLDTLQRIAWAVLANPNLTPDVLTALETLARQRPDLGMRQTDIQHHRAHPKPPKRERSAMEWLQRFISGGGSEGATLDHLTLGTRTGALHPDLENHLAQQHPERLARLEHPQRWDAMPPFQALEHPLRPTRVLQRAADQLDGDTPASVCERLADSLDAPDDALRQLGVVLLARVSDPNRFGDPKAPSYGRLAHVLERVIQHRNTQPETLALLVDLAYDLHLLDPAHGYHQPVPGSRDRLQRAFELIARHPDTPTPTLEKLADQVSQEIAQDAARRRLPAERDKPNRIWRNRHHHDDRLATVIASTEPVRSEHLRGLARHPHARVRAALALNPSTPDATLHDLTRDADRRVARAAQEALDRRGRAEPAA